jgi:hypothetical protein
MDRRDPEYMDVLIWVEKDKGGAFILYVHIYIIFGRYLKRLCYRMPSGNTRMLRLIVDFSTSQRTWQVKSLKITSDHI